jgi:hypothetical protein
MIVAHQLVIWAPIWTIFLVIAVWFCSSLFGVIRGDR